MFHVNTLLRLGLFLPCFHTNVFFAFFTKAFLGLNGAAKSHFGPILGPLGRRCTFLGFKNVDSGPRSAVFCVDLEP